jgi:hypothetical protein
MKMDSANESTQNAQKAHAQEQREKEAQRRRKALHDREAHWQTTDFHNRFARPLSLPPNSTSDLKALVDLREIRRTSQLFENPSITIEMLSLYEIEVLELTRTSAVFVVCDNSHAVAAAAAEAAAAAAQAAADSLARSIETAKPWQGEAPYPWNSKNPPPAANLKKKCLKVLSLSFVFCVAVACGRSVFATLLAADMC